MTKRGFVLCTIATAICAIVASISIALAGTLGLHVQFSASDTTPIPHANFKLYLVSTDYFSGTLSPNVDAFKDYGPDHDISTRESMETTALALSGYVRDKGIEPTVEGMTDDEGTVLFPDLADGTYLVLSDPTEVEPQYLEDGTTVKSTYTAIPFLAFVPENYMLNPKADLETEQIPPSTKDPGLKVDKKLDETVSVKESGMYQDTLSVWNPVEDTEVTDLVVRDTLPPHFTLKEIVSIEGAENPTFEVNEDKTGFAVNIPKLPYGVVVDIVYTATVDPDIDVGDYVNVVKATDNKKLHDEDTVTVPVDKDTPTTPPDDTPVPTPEPEPEPTPEPEPDKTPTQQIVATTPTPTPTPSTTTPVQTIVQKLADTGILGVGSVCAGVGLAALVTLRLRKRGDK